MEGILRLIPGLTPRRFISSAASPRSMAGRLQLLLRRRRPHLPLFLYASSSPKPIFSHPSPPPSALSRVLPFHDPSGSAASPWGAARSFSHGTVNLTPRSTASPAPSPGSNTSSKSSAVLHKVLNRGAAYGVFNIMISIHVIGFHHIHTSQHLGNTVETVQETENYSEAPANGDMRAIATVKRKKLKGKRAVVKWLKQFRYKKKREYERMTAEEKILYKLRKAQKKEERLVTALKKIEPSESSEATHDPEILTPEEHFYYLKMGHKCKNYVPVGRRGIFQGVILNMHLHWKKHQTLKVVVKTFTADEVREIAADLARLSGGIVLDIHEDNTIIMYRGKNYSQPPTEIMSPRVSLTRKKALDKSIHRDALRAVRRYVPRLQQDLEELQVQMKIKSENKVKAVEGTSDADESQMIPVDHAQDLDQIEKKRPGSEQVLEGEDSDPCIQSETISESEDLSDIFETDSDQEDKTERPLYLDQVELFPSEDDGEEPEDFQEHLRHISAASKNGDPSGKDITLAELDEIDKIFLRASSLLKKKRR